MPSLKLSATLSVYFAKQFTMYVLCMFIAITAVVYLVDTIEHNSSKKMPINAVIQSMQLLKIMYEYRNCMLWDFEEK